MAKWLNAIIGSELKESSLYGTEADSRAALRQALELHTARGDRIEGSGEDQKWVVVDREGHPVGLYWLSDENEGSTG